MIEDSGEKGKYIGQIVDGKKNGKGTFFSEKGQQYDGIWYNDKRSGPGILYDVDGTIYECFFSNGKLI